ncbi:hypothetical protein D3C81_2216190 [compost metagenome]
MAKCFQSAHSIGLIIRRYQVKFATAAFHQTWLARHGKLLFIGRTDNAYLLELEGTHFADTLRAEPTQTA